MISMSCQYCGHKAQLVYGDVIYPFKPELFKLRFWYCKPCLAYVGCHKKNYRYGQNGTVPLGILANKELRFYKNKAHLAFDPIWKFGPNSRDTAYIWLASALGIDIERCHIAMFNIDTCKACIEACDDYVKYRK